MSLVRNQKVSLVLITQANQHVSFIIGLKVKLSLPDEGFVIDNLLDSNQSWMYRTSELLYFWRDPRHENLIVVVTFNRKNTPTIGSFSASIFRLRGNESIRIFLRRAQQVFARLSDRSTPKISLKKSATSEQIPIPPKRSRNQPRQPSSPSPTTSSQAEFDPRRLQSTESSLDLYNRRTYSETTISSDSRISPSKRFNSHVNDEDKLTTISNHLDNEYISELVQQLKDLRMEMTALKIAQKSISFRSTSTSPIVFPSEKSSRTGSKEFDAQTQTDLSIPIEQSNEVSSTNERKSNQPIINGNKRIFPSNNQSTGQGRERERDVFLSRIIIFLFRI